MVVSSLASLLAFPLQWLNLLILSALCTFCLHCADNQCVAECRYTYTLPTLLTYTLHYTGAELLAFSCSANWRISGKLWSAHSCVRNKMVVAPRQFRYGGAKILSEQSARLPPIAGNANYHKWMRALVWPKHNYTYVFTHICVKNVHTCANKQMRKRVQTKCQRVQVSVDKMQASASKWRQNASEYR